MKAFSIVMMGLVLLSAASLAKTLRIDTNPDCPDYGYTEYYSDEHRGGMVFRFVLRCDGTTCLGPFTGPVQPQVSVRYPITWPTNLSELEEQAAGITAPGAPLPVYFVDADGVVWKARNPIDSAENAALFTRYLQLKAENETIIGARDPDERALRPIVARYMESRYNTSAEAESLSPEDLRRDGQILRQIVDNRSNLLLRHPPSPSNGQKLVFAPIDPAIGGEATVSAADGRIVWRGDCFGETTVDLGGEPPGLYFLRGWAGTSTVIPLVH